MASYHLTTRCGPAHSGQAPRHAEYIEREGLYADRKDLVAQDHGNMPEWAQADTTDFWRACDELERANGRAYREFEVALPRELSQEQQEELVRNFVSDRFGNKHAYQWAIHDKGDGNPHAHIMYSERIQDGITRDRDQFFKRANSKNPERGGCPKEEGWNVGKGKQSERLTEVRARWAEIQNQALERGGHDARVDHRSLEAQGIERQPEIHVGYRDPKRPEIHAERAERNEAIKAANRVPELRREARAAALAMRDATRALRAERQARVQAREQGANERKIKHLESSLDRMAGNLKRMARIVEQRALAARIEEGRKQEQALAGTISRLEQARGAVAERGRQLQQTERNLEATGRKFVQAQAAVAQRPSVAPARPSAPVEAPKPAQQPQEADDFARLKAVANARDALYQRRAEAYSASSEFEKLRAMPDPKVIQERIEEEKKSLVQLEKDAPKKKGFIITTNQKEIDNHCKIISEKASSIERLEKELETAMKHEPARKARMQEIENKKYNSNAGDLMSDMKNNKEDLIKAYSACVEAHGQEATEAFMLRTCSPKHLELAKDGLAALQRQAHQRTQARGRGQSRGGRGR